MTEKRIKVIKRKNRTTVAKFLALSLENSDKRKCLITLTGNDETYKTTVAIRAAFIEKINSILKRDEYADCQFKYFANIEFGKNWNASNHNKFNPQKYNPHLHIQCFYDKLNPIIEAYDYIVDKLELNPSKCNVLVANNNKVRFSYIIKDYLPDNFSLALEELKYKTYKREPMNTSSHKGMPNYVIKALYAYLSQQPNWNLHKDKYAYILDLKQGGHLIVRKLTNTIEDDDLVKIKLWGFRLITNNASPKTSPYLIKI
jgi:hypothetical protein